MKLYKAISVALPLIATVAYGHMAFADYQGNRGYNTQQNPGRYDTRGRPVPGEANAPRCEQYRSVEERRKYGCELDESYAAQNEAGISQLLVSQYPGKNKVYSHEHGGYILKMYATH